MRPSDVFDKYDAEDDDDAGHPPATKCRRCGSTEVRWRRQGGRWVLFSLRPGVLHRCDPPATEDFKAR